MVKMGGWNTTRITGNTSAGSLANYLLGSGKTALALMFIGKDALQHAEAVVSFVTFEK